MVGQSLNSTTMDDGCRAAINRRQIERQIHCPADGAMLVSEAFSKPNGKRQLLLDAKTRSAALSHPCPSRRPHLFPRLPLVVFFLCLASVCRRDVFSFEQDSTTVFASESLLSVSSRLVPSRSGRRPRR